jgi:hypothetical protein
LRKPESYPDLGGKNPDYRRPRTLHDVVSRDLIPRAAITSMTLMPGANCVANRAGEAAMPAMT